MSRAIKIVAIVGTYRKGGIIDSTIDEILASALEFGAETSKIYLIDRHIKFCTNCRSCTQKEGSERGECIHSDDMKRILDEVEKADAMIPLSFWALVALVSSSWDWLRKKSVK